MKIIQASSANSTTCHYESIFRKWSQFSSGLSMNPWEPTVELILTFLHSLYDEGQSYSSINSAKSALSTIFSLRHNIKFGDLELVRRFMKGIYRLRPPTARYKTTWDANNLLNLFRSWPENNELCLKNLTLKLAGLLAITSGQRVQTLASITIDNILNCDTVQIKITEILKTSRPSISNPIITLPKYSDSKLCVVNALNEYLSRTSTYRNDKKLFLGITKPHKPVCSQTISNWLVSLLDLSGIDTKVYHGHSFRHASTSKVASRGISADSIISHVGWSTTSTVFARYYNRPIESKANDFVNNVLDIN